MSGPVKLQLALDGTLDAALALLAQVNSQVDRGYRCAASPCA
ncbi:MAG TPA: hypothetical protein VKA32_08005 [Gammaproteobacteria bacterium]|nr:hypothetical protein [Gammaproteobacteria bacterium]